MVVGERGGGGVLEDAHGEGDAQEADAAQHDGRHRDGPVQPCQAELLDRPPTHPSFCFKPCRRLSVGAQTILFRFRLCGPAQQRLVRSCMSPSPAA